MNPEKMEGKSTIKFKKNHVLNIYNSNLINHSILAVVLKT
jgi:hypothetical protein